MKLNDNDNDNKMNRRHFIGMLSSGAAAAALAGCSGGGTADKGVRGQAASSADGVPGQMEYRQDRHGEKISLLGYGCMRFPTVEDPADKEHKIIDQEQVNRLIDYAIEHGVNYFDTAPMYHRGKSEEALGIALSRHPRGSYKIATKLSNQRQPWTRERAVDMYNNSFKLLQTDYIDYYLLHSIGNGGMERFNTRFVDNGVLDMLLKDREAGRIRNLGFSFHGQKEAFDEFLALDDRYHWDFVQIQMNYVDWHHSRANDRDSTDAEYMYNELARRGIPVIIMEPLLGGTLATLNDALNARLQELEPESSIASWAFRFNGSFPAVMTVLSGMTYMEHLVDNVRTYSPLRTLTADELEMMDDIAGKYIEFPLISCTGCKYCLPCPYGIEIPAIFAHYNKCVNEDQVSLDITDSSYRKARRAFLVGYDRAVPRLSQADRCIGCRQCVDSCPQNLDIPKLLRHIDRYVEKLKINGVETKLDKGV